MADEVEEYVLLKLVIFGDSGTGKTNLMTRFIVHEYTHDTPSTIGVEFMTKNCSVAGRDVKAQVWDTAGQERFRAISRSLYHGSKGGIVAFDITNRTSFERIEPWLEEFRMHTQPNVPVIIAGLKCDLTDSRVVTPEEGYAAAERHGAIYLEASSLENSGVSRIFETLIEAALQRV